MKTLTRFLHWLDNLECLAWIGKVAQWNKRYPWCYECGYEIGSTDVCISCDEFNDGRKR